MKNNTIDYLDWDSKFFGYPIARITLDNNGNDQLDYIFNQLALKKYRLTYFFIPPEEKEIIQKIIKLGCILVDQKTVYAKKTEKYHKFTNEIIEFQEEELNENLITLALQSGIYSRYRNDKNFVNNEYEKLYIEWLTKSINKTNAFKTLVAKKENEIIGFATLGEKNEVADIGLVAVDDKFRGRGIGSDLIHTADSIAIEMGYKTIRVVTQLQNFSACKLYEKSGFTAESIINVYHYWEE